MVNEKIKFGTDGWRGIIAANFTEKKVKAVTYGVSSYLNKKSKKEKVKVAIGYDTRFLSDRFALAAANVFLEKGINVLFSDSVVTTPVLSNAVVKNQADLGIMITASHNPYYYNGYKIKGSYGGSATMDIVREIEKEVNDNLERGSFGNIYDTYELDENIEKKDLINQYRDHIIDIVDTELLKNIDFKVLIEPLYGAAQKIYYEMLNQISPGNIKEIHSIMNPAFGGIDPEPIGENLNEARDILRKEKFDLAICLDGDGDRIAGLGEDGSFISSHHIFAILLNDLIKRKDMDGRVVKTVTTSSIIERMCIKNNIKLVKTPVGFKYISDEILKGGVIAGGEESGGLWVKGNIPERDGMLIGLRLLEIMCREKKTVNEILMDIFNEYGGFSYHRIDYEVNNSKKDKIIKLLLKGIPEVLKTENVAELDTTDGFKYIMEDGSWLMLRPSGTESLIRVYAETDSSSKLSGLHSIAEKIINNIN